MLAIRFFTLIIAFLFIGCSEEGPTTTPKKSQRIS